MTGVERRQDILAEVGRAVCRDRQATHGEAEDNFADIATVASVILAPKLRSALTAADVALLMPALKLVRAGRNPAHRDSWVDLAGYAVCGAGIVAAEAD